MSSVADAQTFDALILNADLRSSLVTVRSLGKRGLHVAAVATARGAPALSSRWCERGIVFAADEAAPEYLDLLEELLQRASVKVIVSSHDATIALLRAHRARLEEHTRLALASEAALTIAVNKEKTMEVARRLGLRVPREVAVQSASELAGALKEIGLPAVTKPSESWVSNGAEGERISPRLVVTADEARDEVERIARFGGTTLLQQLLTGRREAVSFLYAHGEMHARFAQWALRTKPSLGGESILRQSIAIPPDIGEHAESLVREIDLEGYSEVEFRRDDGGVPHLMEINARLSASVGIAVRAGVDFPVLLYQWALGGPIARVPGYHIGCWMRHLGGDIETTIEMLQESDRPLVTSPPRTILNFGLSFLKPMSYDYADWGDPLPAIAATTSFVRSFARRAFARVRREFS